MKPVPVDLVLHTLAAHLFDPEGTAEAIALGQAIYSHAVDHRALPGQWCADYADPEPQAGWLVRRVLGGDDRHAPLAPGAHVAADMRVVEVEVARRLADAGLALLVTQDAEDLAAATLLLDASRRVVGLERRQTGTGDATESDALRREHANRKINERVAFEAELARRAKDHDFNAKVAEMSPRLISNVEDAARTGALTEELVAAKGETPAPHVFKVGDRVQYARPKDDIAHGAPPCGWEGTIESVDGRTGAYLFRFVGKRWPTCEGEPYWYCAAEELDLVAAPAPPTFKVGDRVIYVEYSSQIVWTVEQVQTDGLSCHLHRSFRPSMVSACTAICNVPVASLTRAP